MIINKINDLTIKIIGDDETGNFSPYIKNIKIDNILEEPILSGQNKELQCTFSRDLDEKKMAIAIC